jgi:hypothetical protein
MNLLEKSSQMASSSLTIDPLTSTFDLQDVRTDHGQYIDKFIEKSSTMNSRDHSNEKTLSSIEWVYFDSISLQSLAYNEPVKSQLEKFYQTQQQGRVRR